MMNQTFVFKTWGAEVDQHHSLETGGFEIMDDLSILNLGQSLDSLKFYKNRSETEKVSAIGCPQLRSFVNHWYGMLANERDIPGLKFAFERILINSFQESLTKLPMNLHCCPNDQICLRVSFIP